jgi:hypothetical protein
MWEQGVCHRSDLGEIKRSRLRVSHMSDMWETFPHVGHVGNWNAKNPQGREPKGIFCFYLFLVFQSRIKEYLEGINLIHFEAY